MAPKSLSQSDSYGIDAPEKGQPYWQEAKDFLYHLLVGKWIKVLHSVDSGSEERLIAFVDLPKPLKLRVNLYGQNGLIRHAMLTAQK